jgi:hypothetical protein
MSSFCRTELQHLARELVDALGLTGPGGPEDVLCDLLDRVVERGQDGAVALHGVVDEMLAGQRLSRPRGDVACMRCGWLADRRLP